MAGFVEEQTNVDEGPVKITRPETMSAESVADLEYWLTGILTRLRRVSKPAPKPESPQPQE